MRPSWQPDHSPTANMSKQYEALADFIRNKMTMSHVYQPVMLMELLAHGGTASAKEIAKAISGQDVAQIDYYEQVTKRMVGRVLTNNRGITSKDKNQYLLNGFGELSRDEITRLLALCDERLNEFVERRGDNVWKGGSAPRILRGSTKYNVLKRASFRCELCGAPPDHRALHVDHILPRSCGGSDDESNLQALCFECNGMKGNRDDTDFRGIHDSYNHRVRGCIFCAASRKVKKIIAQNELAYVIDDPYPVTHQHSLIIPKRHVPDLFGLYQPERNAMNRLMDEQRDRILKSDSGVIGFNVGSNVGADAGQLVMHSHTHLVPRRQGDGLHDGIPGRQPS